VRAPPFEEPFAMSGLTLTQVVQLVAVAVLLSVGQLLFKHGAASAPPAGDLGGVIRLMFTPMVMVAVALYGLTTVLWVYTLQQVPLTSAYPFMALGTVLVPVAAALLLREAVDLRYAAGLALILAGLYVSVGPR
jgi:undecaprenyl phosphate-alpha-L-ara4N flippase subunit ArnE